MPNGAPRRARVCEIRNKCEHREHTATSRIFKHDSIRGRRVTGHTVQAQQIGPKPEDNIFVDLLTRLLDFLLDYAYKNWKTGREPLR